MGTGRTILLAGPAAIAAAVLGSCGHLPPDGAEREPDREGGETLPPAPPAPDLWIIGRDARPAPAASLPRGGELRAKLEGDRSTPFPLRKMDVKARVAVHIASVDVRQVFENPYREKIEAVYVFPLPEDAAVREFVMTIGGREIRGIIREREEARRLYLEARRQGYRASLLAEERPNVFAQSVANIEPGRSIEVAITYFHALPWRDDAFELVVPLAIGPRYNPSGLRDGVGAAPAGSPGASGQSTEVAYLRPGDDRAPAVSIEVDLAAGTRIGAVECRTHPVEVARPAEDRAIVHLAAGDAVPDRDFVLRWRPAAAGPVAALAAHRDATGAYLALVLMPPAAAPASGSAAAKGTPGEPGGPAREVVIVLDTSGSMGGEPLGRAKAIARAALGRLGPADTFDVVRFSGEPSLLAPAPLPAIAANVRDGLAYIDGIRAGGGTEMLAGLRAALAVPHSPGRFRSLLFLTDGFIGNEPEVIAEVRRGLGDGRLFAVGIGSAPNRFLIEEMARAGRGAAAYAPLDGGDRSMEDFLAAIERPAATDVRIDWELEQGSPSSQQDAVFDRAAATQAPDADPAARPRVAADPRGGPRPALAGAKGEDSPPPPTRSALRPAEVFPDPVPDLWPGRPLAVVARFDAPGRGEVKVRAVAGGRPAEMAVAVDLGAGPPSPAIACVWARSKIAALSRSLLVSGTGREAALIRETALRYGLLSDRTSFVAVDSTGRTAGDHGTTVPVPAPVPAGVRYETTVGEH